MAAAIEQARVTMDAAMAQMEASAAQQMELFEAQTRQAGVVGLALCLHRAEVDLDRLSRQHVRSHVDGQCAGLADDEFDAMEKIREEVFGADVVNRRLLTQKVRHDLEELTLLLSNTLDPRPDEMTADMSGRECAVATELGLRANECFEMKNAVRDLAPVGEEDDW